jgi:acyl-CoA reductase-like NAD-dependent aldehyde dehydrogenase
MLLELWIEAGLPPDAISIVQTRREDAAAVTEALIAHPAIRKVEFVGSAGVGRIIGSLAGKHLKPILMELGGKCAAVVLEDANLEDAATKCIAGGKIIGDHCWGFRADKTQTPAFNHHGQICFSTERIIVLQSISDAFVELLKQRALASPQYHGVNTRIVKASYNMLLDAEKKGATFILGRPEYLSETALAPAILSGVTKDMDIWDEESFGPSTTVIVVEDYHQAIHVVNESRYGLDAILFTRDMKKAMDMSRELEVGRIRVNGLSHEGKCNIPVHRYLLANLPSDLSYKSCEGQRIWHE